MPDFAGNLFTLSRHSVFVVGACLLLFSCDRLTPAPAPAKKAPLPEIVSEPGAEVKPAAAQEPIDPAIPELTINKSAQVSVLGYHEFVTGQPRQDMQINIDHFRDQMQALKDARLPVISMSDFLAWRRGEKDIPDPCVVITMDDGWKSVYQLALPVLKEFNYPFTIFLYKKYVNGGGRALTTAEISGLTANGAEVGSHSVSHKVAAELRREKSKGPVSYEAFVRSEMIDSKQFLEDLTGKPVRTYAYPGGTNAELDHTIGQEAGYEALFTVNPARVTWDTPASALPRYIVYGRDARDANFLRAVSSRGTSEGDLAKALLGGPAGEALVITKPKPEATIAERQPLIEVDVRQLEGIDAQSVKMKIAGFGSVPAEYDPAAGVIRYRVQEALRSSECQVYVTFKRASESKPDAVNWRFNIDTVAHYLPDAPLVLVEAIPGDYVSPETPEDAGTDEIPSPVPEPVSYGRPTNAAPAPPPPPRPPHKIPSGRSPAHPAKGRSVH